MSDKNQYDLMCQALRSERVALTKLREGTRNYKLIDKINDSLLEIDTMCLDLDHVWSESDEKWTIRIDEPKGFQERWQKVIDRAQGAEEDIAKMRWWRGWEWFFGFAFALLALVGSYIYLHWRFPSTDQEIFLWIDNPRAYAEVAWWALFGVLSWVLYNLQHYVREGEDIRLWSMWYLSKLFTGGIIAMVVVVALKQIDLGTTITNNIIPVIMGFILGYYSDRARDYLDLIRDKLFSATQVPDVTIVPIEPASTSPVVVRGKVDGPPGIEGTLTVNKNPPTPVAIDGHGNFAEVVELTAGRNLIKVEAKSPAKKTGLASVAVNLPGSKPVVAIAAPQNGSTVSPGKVTISGTVKDEGGIPYSGLNIFLLPDRAEPVSAAVGEGGSFSAVVDLKEGENLIRVVLGGHDTTPEFRQVVKAIRLEAKRT